MSDDTLSAKKCGVVNWMRLADKLQPILDAVAKRDMSKKLSASNQAWKSSCSSSPT